MAASYCTLGGNAETGSRRYGMLYYWIIEWRVMKNIVVIGGGIIGLSSAFYLQRAGYQVTVLDKDDFKNNCSWGNAGYVCPSHFIPLAAPGIVKQGLKWMLNARSPFYVQPSLNRALFDWGMKFIKSATQRNVEMSAVPLRDIALFSQEEYAKWALMPEFDFAFQRNGMLEIFKTAKNAEHAHHTVEAGRQLGLDVELLDATGLQQQEPHTPVNAQGAIFFRCDSHVDPDKLMSNLLVCLRAAGVKLESYAEVTGFEKTNSRVTKVKTAKQVYDADEVIIATGSWSREVAAMLHTRIPLMPGRGYSVTLTDSPFTVNHPAVLVEGRAALTPLATNKIRFGGTMEVVPTNTPPRYNRVAGILQAVKDYFPEFTIPMPAKENIWYGYRPCSADGLPYIGRIKSFRNVIVATGHSMLGLSLGAGTGKLVSELVQEKRPGVNLTPFAVERFS